MATIQREYKDRLFNFIFGSEENKVWTLSLYNAVNGTAYTDPTGVQINTIKEVLLILRSLNYRYNIDNSKAISPVNAFVPMPVTETGTSMTLVVHL